MEDAKKQESRIPFKLIGKEIQVPDELKSQAESKTEELFKIVSQKTKIDESTFTDLKRFVSEEFQKVAVILKYKNIPTLWANLNDGFNEGFEQALKLDKWDNEMPTAAAYPQQEMISFDPDFFKQYAAHKDDEKIKSKLTTELQQTIAEEMFHIYTFKRYPAPAYRGLYANYVGGEKYHEHITEQSAKMFAREYSKLDLSVS